MVMSACADPAAQALHMHVADSVAPGKIPGASHLPKEPGSGCCRLQSSAWRPA